MLPRARVKSSLESVLPGGGQSPGIKIHSIEEFEKLPVGTAIIVIPTEKGLDRWEREETTEWLKAIGRNKVLYKINNYSNNYSVAIKPEYEISTGNDWWGLAHSDFGIDANIYLAKPAKCVFCGAEVEYDEKYIICTECYRVQEE